MAQNNRNSQEISVFHNRKTPEPGRLAGYGFLIQEYDLTAVLPDRLAIISQKHKKYETAGWQVFTPRHEADHTLSGQLTFALKHEGIELGVLKALFSKIDTGEITAIVKAEPLGIYSRKIWFLFEWLMDKLLPLPDLKTGNFVNLVDEALQFGGAPENSTRHKVRNNLPGVRDFCPMIRRTEKLQHFIDLNLADRISKDLQKIHSDVLARAAAFLLLKDSKASYAIEGERPPQNRAQRWGRVIGEAGHKELTADELLRLQQIVIDNPRFVKMGWRTQGGFVGEHDRESGDPMPDHISAKWQDLPQLIQGLLTTSAKLENDPLDPVLTSALIAFGFVFIHPFVDGNGRIHRYLIHDVLIRKKFVKRGIIFPVSAIILERLDEYREVLEAYSLPVLDLIAWRPTKDHNVEVLNDTADLYKYFDATRQAEFLYDCVWQTIEQTIPQEVHYLEKYDRLKSYLDDRFEMADKTVALLLRFLEQGKGKLSQRSRTKEFQALTDDEVTEIETKYKEIFPEDPTH